MLSLSQLVAFVYHEIYPCHHIPNVLNLKTIAYLETLLYLFLFGLSPHVPWYVLSCLWDGAYKRTLAVNR